jgi:hypothetical protein
MHNTGSSLRLRPLIRSASGSRQIAVAAILSLACSAFLLSNATAQGASHTGAPRASIYRSQATLYAQEHQIPLRVATRQLEWQRLAPGLQERARRELGLDFGGVWIDNADGGRVKLGITTLNPLLLVKAHEVVANSGLTEAVDIVQVPRSEVQLTKIADWLSMRFAQADVGTATPLMVGILPDQSVVRISLPTESEPTPAQQHFVAEARKRYGNALITDFYAGYPQLLACSYPFCTPPLRAGIKVGPSATFGKFPGGKCTGAFISRGKGDGKLYQFTAGHCEEKLAWGTRLTSEGSWQEIGSWAKGNYNEAGDVGIYQIANDSVWNTRPWVYWAGTSESYPIFSDATPVKGQGICVSGAACGESNCGTVSELNLEVNSEGTILKGMVRANFCAVPGDSGAPVHYYGVSYGILSGRVNLCDTYFTPILKAEELMNVDVRHESECDPLFESPIKTGDMTGDGKEDIFQFPGTGKGNAWESKGTSYTSLGEIGSGFGSAYQDRVGDKDGDGDDDLFQMTDSGVLYAWESKGTSYTSLGEVGSGFGSACDTRVADINGDGKADILRFTNDGYGYGWLAGKSGYESLGQVGTGFGSTYQDRTGDINGDGDDDLFQILDNGKVYKWDSNGSSYSGGSELFSGVGNASQVRFADTEGDGDDDIFRFTDTGVGSLWKSKGSAYESIGTIGNEFGLTRQMRVADIDGDGDADILKFADDGKLYAWTFNGSTYISKGNIASGFGKP